MVAFDLFSIGHSNAPIDRFVGMLASTGVTAIADVRSVPASRHCPWFAKSNLSASLAQAGIAYAAMGEALGGRPGDDRLYRDGVADYEAMAQQRPYQEGLDRLVDGAARHLVCVMCAEREPLDCHRCLLVARSLAERGLAVGHILHDGRVEAHAETERRLLALDTASGETCDLFASGQAARLAAAYRRRTRAVAFRWQGSSRHRAAKNK
jgi:uncharacterized protein (DUF488 family)